MWKLFNALTGKREKEKELELLPPLQCRRGAPCGRECLDPGAAATHGADEVTVPGKDDDIPAIVLLSFSLSLSSSSSSSNSSWSFSSSFSSPLYFSFSFSPSLSNLHKAIPRRRHGYWCGHPNCPQLGRFSRIHSDGVATLLCSVSCTVQALLIAFGLPTTIHGRITNSLFLFFLGVFFFPIIRLKETQFDFLAKPFSARLCPKAAVKCPSRILFGAWGLEKLTCYQGPPPPLLLLLLESASNRKWLFLIGQLQWLAQVVRVKLFLCHACHTISIYSQNNKPFRFRGHQSSSVCRFACFVVCFTQSSNVSIVSFMPAPIVKSSHNSFSSPMPLCHWLITSIRDNWCSWFYNMWSKCVHCPHSKVLHCLYFCCRNYKLQDCFHWVSLVAWIATTKSLLTPFLKLPSVYVCYLHVLCLHGDVSFLLHCYLDQEFSKFSTSCISQHNPSFDLF